MGTVSFSNLEKKLNEINTGLESIKRQPLKQGEKPISDEMQKKLTDLNKDLEQVLNSSEIKAKKENISPAMLAVVNKTLITIKSIQQERNAQEKIGALFASITEHLKQFQSKVKDLKQFKRGEKVVGVDLDQQGKH
jgi:hypothetical protein